MGLVSIPSNGSIQFLHWGGPFGDKNIYIKSQSPQTGQFNSYSLTGQKAQLREDSLNPLKRVNSILTVKLWPAIEEALDSLNPLKRVNSILTKTSSAHICGRHERSQSPQTGQFNSYYTRSGKECVFVRVSIPSNGSIQFLRSRLNVGVFNSFACLNPLKRVNSILTNQTLKEFIMKPIESLNPLKRVNSILTLKWEQHDPREFNSLNPLKRVNSILT